MKIHKYYKNIIIHTYDLGNFLFRKGKEYIVIQLGHSAALNPL